MSALSESLQGVLAKARDLSDQVDKEGRDFTADERTQVSGWLDEAKGLKAKLVEAEGDQAMRKAIADLGDGIGLAEPGERKNGASAFAAPGQGKSLGERFTEAPELKRFMEQYALGGHIPETAKGLRSTPVAFKTLLTGASATGAGALMVPDRDNTIVPLGRRPLMIRNMVTNGTTTSDSVDFVRVTTETNNAAAVAEATAAGDTSGTKPESAMALAKLNTTVKTIAHWLPVTKRALADAAQIRSLIDSFLMDGLELVLEDEMLTGDGSGEHFDGLLHLSGVQAQAWDTDLFTTTRTGLKKVRTVGREVANAYLLHPDETMRLDLEQNNEGDYYYGGPAAGGGPNMTLWRLPVVESDAITTGNGIVGNFRQAVLLDREQASIQVSDSHSDFFIRNLVALLAEARFAFYVRKPVAFVKLDLTA